MRYPTFGFILALILAGAARAATNAPTGPQPERWLMVVDVSSSMKNRAPAVREAVATLLDSSMNGQLLEGHEIGMWTFNDELHTDMDVMKWMDFRTNAIKHRLLTHLDAQKYGRQSSFDETIENLKAVVADSRRLTLILFSDGDELFPGTPYEAAIAEFFKSNRDKARSGKVPIITVLRGSRGEWAGLAQSHPPWPVTFPDFPPEPASTAAPANPPSARRPVIVAEPLVVRGPDPLSKEIEEKGLATNSKNLVLQKPAQPPPPAEPVITNVPATAGAGESSDTSPPQPVEPINAEPQSRPLGLVVVATVGLLSIAVVAALLLRRRVSSRQRTSLITRSMNSGQDKP
jgi:hypothetical protein